MFCDTLTYASSSSAVQQIAVIAQALLTLIGAIMVLIQKRRF